MTFRNPLKDDKGHRDLFWDLDYLYSPFAEGNFKQWVDTARAKNAKNAKRITKGDKS